MRSERCGEEVPPTARRLPANRPSSAPHVIAPIHPGVPWGGEGGRCRAVGGLLAGVEVRCER